MEVFEIILDVLNNLIVDKAFNKKIKFKKRLLYIFIYYTLIILLLVLTVFFGINYIKAKNIIGYFLIIMGIILFILLVLPPFCYKKQR